MSVSRRSPQVRDRMLGALLRAARMQVAGLSLEHAAAMADVSLATMSRTESGKRKIGNDDIAILLALYGVPRRQRELVMAEARTASAAVWWQEADSLDRQDAFLVAHEARAKEITEWSAFSVPALLQTRAYAFGMMNAGGILGPRLESIWENRHIRQKASRSADYMAYIHQHGLRTPFGGKAAYLEQLRHLLRLIDQGLGVRVIRSSAEPSLVPHSWTLLQFATESPLVHVPLLEGTGIYLHDCKASAYAHQMRRLREAACSPEQTHDYLVRLVSLATRHSSDIAREL